MNDHREWKSTLTRLIFIKNPFVEESLHCFFLYLVPTISTPPIRLPMAEEQYFADLPNLLEEPDRVPCLRLCKDQKTQFCWSSQDKIFP
jgi:hypothetical protein